MHTRATAIARLAYTVMIPLACTAVLAQPPSEQVSTIGWFGKQTVAGVSNEFGYVMFANGTLLQVTGDKMNPQVTAIATYSIRTRTSERERDLIVFWHDGSVEVGTLFATSQEKLRYTIREHSDRRQVGTSTEIVKHDIRGDSAQSLITISVLLGKLRANQQLLQRLENLKVADGLNKAMENLRDLQTQEFLKRLEIVTSP